MAALRTRRRDRSGAAGTLRSHGGGRSGAAESPRRSGQGALDAFSVVWGPEGCVWSQKRKKWNAI